MGIGVVLDQNQKFRCVACRKIEVLFIYTLNTHRRTPLADHIVSLFHYLSTCIIPLPLGEGGLVFLAPARPQRGIVGRFRLPLPPFNPSLVRRRTTRTGVYSALYLYIFLAVRREKSIWGNQEVAARRRQRPPSRLHPSAIPYSLVLLFSCPRHTFFQPLFCMYVYMMHRVYCTENVY